MATMSGDSVDKKEKERNDIDKLFKKVSRYFYIPGYSADVVDFPSDEESSSKPERDKQTDSPETDISSDVPGEIDSGKKRKSESEKQTDKLFRKVSQYFYIPGYSADVVDFPSDEGSSSESEGEKQRESPATDISRDVPGEIDPGKSSEKLPAAGSVESQYHEHEEDVTEEDADKPGQSSDFKAYSKSLQGPGPVDIDKLQVSFRKRGKKPKLVFDLRRKSQYQHGDVSDEDADKTIESSSVSSMETVKTPEQEFDKVRHGAGVGVLATGDLVICDYGRGFVVYTPQGEYITSHSLPDIHDVAGTADGGMVAVSHHTLYRLDKQWKELWTVEASQLGDRIHGGVSVDIQGVIYIRLFDSVCVVGDDGTILRHIRHHVPRARYGRPWSFSGIAVQPWGDILLTDPHNHCIVVLSASGEPKSKLKEPNRYPWGVAVDADGIVAVTDYRADTVTMYSPTGQYMESWGKYGSEPGEFKGPTGIAFAASGEPKGELEGANRYPCHVAVDADGIVAVTDYHASSVTVYSPTGQYMESWGKYGAEPEFKGPTGIAFSPSGDLIVCDSRNHRVQIF